MAGTVDVCTARVSIAYFVHDLNDPAVRRRVRMLLCSNEELRLLGFVRNPTDAVVIEGVPYWSLGQTMGGHLARRIGTVLSAAVQVFSWGRAVSGADVIIARNLEMLVLAVWAKVLLRSKARLAYECLDIHSLMVSAGFAGSLLRGIERWLLGKCSLLIVSSPAFVESHFGPRHGYDREVLLIENKILEAEEFEQPSLSARPSAPPWVIGWFGVLRCARSLRLLDELTLHSAGKVHVVLRGRPTDELGPLIGAACARNPWLRFGGPYDRRRDLGRMYADVHFVWAMDFYEVGANSSWLLPNRIYEGGFYNGPPIALRGVETGRWVERHELGFVATPPLQECLAEFFDSLTPTRYDDIVRRSRAADRSLFVYTESECRELCHRIFGA